MQEILSRYRRRDAVMKMSMIAVFGAIVFSVALPFVITQPSRAPIPPFKPFRAQENARLAPSDAGDANRLSQQTTAGYTQ